MKKIVLLAVLVFTHFFGYSQSFTSPIVSNKVCTDTNSQYQLFNFNTITAEIFSAVNPSNYSISYHLSQPSAQANVSPLPTNYTNITNPQTVYARIRNLNTNYVQILPVVLTVSSVKDPVYLTVMTQCDDDNDGQVVFDLTAPFSLINTSNPIAIYSNLNDAKSGTNPISSNLNAYSMSSQNSSIVYYYRENLVGECDNLYEVNINRINCSLLYDCSSATSLCNSYGIPFPNLTGGFSGNNLGCLGSVPNPKWFYLPIQAPGNISMTISQFGNSGNQLDVDYILFGPFTDPVTPCANPNDLLDHYFSCSFSAQTVETFTIPNALEGEFYLLIVTNYSGIAGSITITDTSNSQGGLNCAGIRMNAFLDLNNNGSQQMGESNFQLGSFEYLENNNGISNEVSSSSGFCNVYNQNSTTTYDLSYHVNPEYQSLYTVTIPSYNNIVVPAGGSTQTFNFPIVANQVYNDLSVVIVPLNSPRPGLLWGNKIIFTNKGNQSVSNGLVTFVKDSNVTLVNPPSNIVTNANGFTCDFTNLSPFESREILVYFQVPTLPTILEGQLLTNSVTITPIGDAVAENNSNSLSEEVVTGFDPNNKIESHGGRIVHSDFTSNDFLYYTLHFENLIGPNTNIINIRITDNLDFGLDENSFEMVSSSHFYTLRRVGNEITWTFNAIDLPFSVVNSTIGKGYLIFKIKPKPGYAVGDNIPNNAIMHFDFNDPITTNTYNTFFVESLLSNSQFSSHSFVIYPNPSEDILNIQLTQNAEKIAQVKISDIIGKEMLLLNGTNSNHQTLDVSILQAGVYFVEITTDSNAKATKKLIIK